ncbi:sulfotransferase [Winogradskyella helgolandensis]|uniref:sulfotransferase n=1 Tax=Winogradskyella helgolandensis TaxID=2697010 RepID=UPI0015CAB41E|nr:sulfotransferase [Winogradskyella helgolandensis]
MTFYLKSKPKIFCIGFNKTGTTTIEKVLKDFKIKLGNQEEAEMLITNWFNRDFKEIFNYVKSATAFQDIPFSLPYTFIALAQKFPNAKFILTIRDNDEQWYNSIVKFHSKLWSSDESAPKVNELKNANYRYKGLAYEYIKQVFNTPDDDLYHKQTLIKTYNNHNNLVKDYFRAHPEKLIVINTSNKADYFRLCDFLKEKPLHDNFPWENKTSDIK